MMEIFFNHSGIYLGQIIWKGLQNNYNISQ